MGVFLRDPDFEAAGLLPAVARPYGAVRPLTAAAARVKINDKGEAERLAKRKKSATWQQESWAYFDCADTETQILTIDGWRNYDEVAIGDMVRTLDHVTGTAGWEPIEKVVVYDVEDIPMLSMEMRHHSSLTTMDHRWPVYGQVYADMRRSHLDRRWVTSRTMPSEVALITAAPTRDLPAEPKWSDDFVALVAWFWTEGSIARQKSGRRKSITISQSMGKHPEYTAEIEMLLTKVFPGQWRIWDRPDGQRYFHLRVSAADELLSIAPDKVVSLDFVRSLTLSQLQLFCDISIRADGHHSGGPSRWISQSEPARLSAYEYACILRGTTPHTLDQQVNHGRTMIMELPRATARPRKKARRTIRYTGKVWCVQTPSKTWMARRNGTVFYTGNTIGEIKYAFTLTGSVMSRMKLFVGYVETPSNNPSRIKDVDGVPEGMAEAAEKHLQRLESGYGGIPGLLRDASINLSVPGECLLVQEFEKPASGIPEKWTIRSTDEVEVDTGGNFGIRSSSALKGPEGLDPLSPNAFVGRIWRPHARMHDDADSSMRALLDLCLAEGTLVYTPDGPKPIEQIRAGDRVISFQDGKLITAEVGASMRTAQDAATLTVTTSQGHRVTGTPDHPVLVLAYDNPGKGRARNYELAYRKMGELRKGDLIVSMCHADGLTADGGVDVDYQEFWLAGVYAGDGTDTGGGLKARICYPDPLLAADIDRAAIAVWGGPSRRSGVNLNLPSGSRDWIKDFGLNVGSHERRVPQQVWEAGPKAWQAFVDGFERTDAWRSKTGVHYDSTSFELLQDFQAMARMLGRRTSVIKQARTAGPVEMFTNGTHYTANARDMWRMDIYDNDMRNGRATFIERKPAVAELIKDERVAVAAVKTIEEGPIVDVYDITVPGPGNFVAEGIVVHNCAELLLLNRTVRATAKSRLNAGALFIPDGLSVAAQPDVSDEDGDFETVEDDAFEQELIAAMTMPIQDEDSASAVVPLLIRGPGELGGQIKQFRFERSFDAALVERADRVLDRILQGLDIPKDIITGLSQVKYSNAIVIQESLYRTHIEPLALLICDALTMIFMRPALRAMGYDDEFVENTVIWYDPTDILTSQDRAQHADTGFDKYLLSGQSWRATHGFAETDAPDGDELLNRIVVQRGQITAELTEAVLAKIAPASFKEAREAALAGKETQFPENLQNLLESGQLPEQPEGAEPLPPEILEGLPVPSPASPGTPEEEAPEEPTAGTPA